MFDFKVFLMKEFIDEGAGDDAYLNRVHFILFSLGIIDLPSY
jgi:hypothetical protein